MRIDAIERVLELTAAGQHQVGAAGDGDPSCAHGTDDHGTDHHDGIAKSLCLGADEGLDRLAAELIALVVGKAHAKEHEQVPHDNIEDGTERRAAGRETEGDTEQDRDQGTDDQRVAKAGERAHEAGADAVDGVVIDGLAVCASLLEAGGDADNHGADLRLGVEERGVGLEGLLLLLGRVVELLDDRKHGAQVTEGLHVLLREASQVAIGPVAERLGKRFLREFLLLCH